MVHWVVRAVVALAVLAIALLAIALVVTQTSWFRDWARDYAVRSASRALHGTLSIGRLSGSLFFGAELSEVAVELDGRRVISVERVGVDYSVLDILSRGIVIDDIRLERPVVHLRKTGEGWNLARLVRKERREEERRGPGRRIEIGEIGITGGIVTIEGVGRPAGVRVPEQVTNIDGRFSFVYEPVSFVVGIEHLSFVTAAPELELTKLRGRVTVDGSDVALDDLSIQTPRSAVHVSGAVLAAGAARSLAMQVQSPGFSFDEFGRLIPALAGIDTRPAFSLALDGPPGRLTVQADLNSSAGGARGDVVVDLAAPGRSIAGEAELEEFDIRPWLKGAGEQTDLTGRAAFNLTIPAAGEELQGIYQFTGPRVRYGRYRAADVRVKGRVNGRRVTFDAGGGALGARFTARGALVRPAQRGGPVAVTASGSATGVDLRNVRELVAVPLLASNLSLEYAIRVEGRSARGRVRFRGRSGLEGAGIEPGTTASFARQPGRLTYAAAGRVADLNLHRIGRALRIKALAAERFDSRIGGHFELEGSGTSAATLRLQAGGTLVDSRLLGGDVRQLAYEVEIRERALTAAVKGGFAGFDLNVLAGRPDLDGTLTGRVDLNVGLRGLGTAAGVELASASGHVSLRDSKVAGFDLDRLEATGRFAEDQVAHLETLELAGSMLEAKASGTLALGTSSSSDLQYSLRAGNLQPMAKLIGQPLAGTLTISGRVTGNRAALKTDGTLRGTRLQYGDQFEALELASKYAVQVPDFAIDRLQAGGRVEATFVRVAGRELTELATDLTYMPGRIEFDATAREGARTIAAAGDLVPHPDHREIHLTSLAIGMEDIEWRTVEGSDVAIQYGADALVLRGVRLVSGGQMLRAEGRLGLGDHVRSDLVVQASRVDMQTLGRLAADDRRLAGELNANVTVRGTWAAPIVVGEAVIENGAVRSYTFHSVASTFRYDGEGITLQARLQQTPAEWLTARGFVPITVLRPSPERAHVPPRDRDEIDLRIQTSTIHLGFVQGFTTQLADVTGTMQADVRVTGSGHDPHFAGVVEIRQGGFHVVPTNITYSGLDTRLELQPDRFAIDSFGIVDENGRTMTVSGGLAFHERQVGDLDVRLVPDGLEVFDNEFGEADLDGTLRITGGLLRPRVDGKLQIRGARLQVDELLRAVQRPAEAPGRRRVAARGSTNGPRAADGAAQGRQPETEATASPWKTLALDVRLTIPDTLIARGRDLRARGAPIGLGDLNITLGGDLRVQKEPGQDVRLTGVVKTVRGTYEFQGRRFEILRDGEIRFLGLSEINPSLDLTAEREIAGVVAQVHITGSVRGPELTLSSQPPMDQADILSLIVFNQPANQLGTGQRVSLAQRAGALATGFVVTPMVESLGEALDLDVLEFQTADGLAPRVTIGEQIGERVFVKFSRQFGDQDISEFLLEYRLAEFLRLQTAMAEGRTIGNRSLTRRAERAGVDLIFFFSY